MSASVTSLLRQVPLFAGLEEAMLEMLAAHSRRRRFKAGETLFHVGDPGYTLYIILSGHIHIQTFTPAGEVVHQAQRGPGEHVGELALIDGKPRMADAVVAQECDLLMLDHADLIGCIEQSPKMALSIMSCLADRLRQAADHLESRQGLDVLGRLARLLLQLAEEHGQEDPSGGKRIRIKLSQQTLADQVDATRESVNRALSSLKEAGAIRYEGRTIIILNVNKLRQCCR